jgi:hypothetical protein
MPEIRRRCFDARKNQFYQGLGCGWRPRLRGVTLAMRGLDETGKRLKRSARFEVREGVAPFALRVDASAAGIDVCLLNEALKKVLGN